MTEIDHSLRRLGTDYVDLYQIHRLDPATPIEETLEALHDVVKAGKARYIGASSMHAWQFAKALHLQRPHGWARFVSMQDHYNLLSREEEREMLPLCADEGVGRSCGARSPAAAWPASEQRSATDAFGERTLSPTCSTPTRTAIAQSSTRSARSPRRAALAARRSRSPGCGQPRRRRAARGRQQAAADRRRGRLARGQADRRGVAGSRRPYTPRYDFQGISSDAEMQRIWPGSQFAPAAR